MVARPLLHLHSPLQYSGLLLVLVQASKYGQRGKHSTAEAMPRMPMGLQQVEHHFRLQTHRIIQPTTTDEHVQNIMPQNKQVCGVYKEPTWMP